MSLKFIPIITCEHAGREIPAGYDHLFKGLDDVLQSHRGWDPGALEAAKFLAEKLNAPFFKCDTTRLLVEPNRSMGSASLFSEYSIILDLSQREAVLNSYYYPHRNAVEAWIRNAPGLVLHISMHSFTPVWEGKTRDVDIGLLFDPSRQHESEFCKTWREELMTHLGDFKVKFNEPYKGIDDGFTTYLRTLFPDENYMGIEIEINQRFIGAQEQELIFEALYKGIHTIGSY